ncbi:MAG: vWA domain-containing protein [Spirochaetota bacterium]|nr:vWA domain-containing protein [Spirochaetota bacterium]
MAVCGVALPGVLTTTEISEQLTRLLEPFEDAISDYWRRNKSMTESIELSNALRALRKVAGHLGQNVGRIEWSGMTQNPLSAIVLDPSLIMGAYPIVPQKFDYLVGIVAHESLHKIEWSDHVWKKIDQEIKKWKTIEKIIFHKIVYVGENIYIDKISEETVFGLYTRVYRNVEFKKIENSLKNDIRTLEELVYLWWKDSFGDKTNTFNFDDYKEPLALLNNATHGLIAIRQNTKGVTARCEERFRLYMQLWEDIKNLISTWDVIEKVLSWYPPTEVREAKTTSKKKSKKPVLSPRTIQEIETRLAIGSADITPIIRSVVGDDPDIIPITRWDFNIPIQPIIDRHFVSRLKTIFQDYADRKVLLNRGLTSGKVDKSRLYRAPINGRCFMYKQAIAELDWNICLLIDASGSMRGPKWKMVESTIATIHKALSGFRIGLQAYGYFESDKVCMLSSLIKGKDLLSIPPSGLTASGEAIIGAAYFIPDDGRRKFLIHVTDGESNFGSDVQHAINYCRSKRIHLVTIGCGYKDREEMSKQYGKTIQFLDHFGQLPNKLESLLRWTLLYEKDRLPVNFAKRINKLEAAS